MNYSEAIVFIHGTNKFGRKLGLANINCLLELMGNPEKDLKVIHIAGTNGKGSVGAMLASALTAAGFKTGFYSSPHLVSVRERFRIDGK
ncbi:MAG: bifunctional folylpolyglutamate synthase/dihydrofolate synthase, partial [Clostridiales bacterium]|nr:bifunctional folylpolyglutamate synthase/dihydrofolate synthase [Clostridiales bacterium]